MSVTDSYKPGGFAHHLASGHLRFSYTTGMDRLQLAVERLAGVLA